MNLVITGASAGIGKALATSYAKPGIHLGLVGRNQQRLEAVAEQCRCQGATVEIASIDVTNDSAIKQWLLDFDRQHPLDLLIANAGVTSSIVNGENESWEQVKQVLAINVQGVFNTVYPLIEPMQQRKKGHIALMSSLAAYHGMPVSPSYCASKAALKSYGEALRGYLQQDGVKVSVICPGFVKTELSDKFYVPKLLMISSEQAAQAIQKGLRKKQAVISFPFPVDLFMKFLAILPTDWANYLLQITGYDVKRKIAK